MLQRLVSEREARAAALARTTGIDQRRVYSVVARLRAAARAEFRRGYEAALELIERQGFHVVEALVTHDWDVYEAADWLDGSDELLRRFRSSREEEHPVFLDGGNRAYATYGTRFATKDGVPTLDPRTMMAQAGQQAPGRRRMAEGRYLPTCTRPPLRVFRARPGSLPPHSRPHGRNCGDAPLLLATAEARRPASTATEALATPHGPSRTAQPAGRQVTRQKYGFSGVAPDGG